MVSTGEIALAPVFAIAAMEPVGMVRGLDGRCFAGVALWLLWSLLFGVKRWEPNTLFLGACLGFIQPPVVACPGLIRTLLRPDAIGVSGHQ